MLKRYFNWLRKMLPQSVWESLEPELNFLEESLPHLKEAKIEWMVRFTINWWVTRLSIQGIQLCLIHWISLSWRQQTQKFSFLLFTIKIFLQLVYSLDAISDVHQMSEQFTELYYKSNMKLSPKEIETLQKMYRKFAWGRYYLDEKDGFD